MTVPNPTQYTKSDKYEVKTLARVPGPLALVSGPLARVPGHTAPGPGPQMLSRDIFLNLKRNGFGRNPPKHDSTSALPSIWTLLPTSLDDPTFATHILV